MTEEKVGRSPCRRSRGAVGERAQEVRYPVCGEVGARLRELRERAMTPSSWLPRQSGLGRVGQQAQERALRQVQATALLVQRPVRVPGQEQGRVPVRSGYSCLSLFGQHPGLAPPCPCPPRRWIRMRRSLRLALRCR